ncbi:MAG TPA: redoxin domain-containing protein [Candidatus Polarisedimenticolia bacterium]|nr:redoxin domain-containing protein [Candidatus Polarisedimenticolia bacterium]
MSTGSNPGLSVSPAGPPARAGSAWALAILATLLLAGTAIGLYLTRFHENALYGDASVTLENCPRTETTNCEVVNTSESSELLGVPISALGIPTYLLLLWLTLQARRRPRLLGMIFAIGLLTAAYSVYLYYVSTVRIGFLCIWCFRLYCINAGIPVLALLAARRSPLGLGRELFEDLRRFVPPVRAAAALFAALLLMTVAGDRLYRQSLTRLVPAARTQQEMPMEGVPAEPAAPSPAATPARVATEPTPTAVPAAQPTSPQTRTPPPSGRQAAVATPVPPTRPAAVPAGARLDVSAPLKRFSARKGSLDLSPFDLQARIGRGRPLALIYWAAGYPFADSTLVTLARFLREQAPQYEVFAIAGRREDQKAETLWEGFCMLGLPADLPLLMDEGFALYGQLGMTEVPNLALVDGAGNLVTAKIKSLSEMVAGPPTVLTGEQLIRRVAQGQPTPPIQNVPPYYPATALYGACAPEFTLPDLATGQDVTFTGRAPNGKPTLLLFWSSTCKHCQKEIPQLLLHVRAHPGEFNVVSVALIKPDRPDGYSHRRVTQAYVRTNGIPWPVLDDSSGYAEDLYGIVSTPTTLLITPSGRVAGAWFHPHENLDEAIARDLPRLYAAAGECRPAGRPETSPRVAFSVLGPDSARVPLETLTDRPSLVHLWATWCAPCQAELPSLLKLRQPLEAMGGRLVLVSVEDAQAADRIRSYGARLDPHFQSFRDPEGGLAELLNLAYSVPRTYLIGRGGRLLKTFYGAQKWDDPSFEESVRTLLQLRRRSG